MWRITLTILCVVALATSAPGADPAEIEKLVRNLGAESGATRVQAMKRLQQIGKPAVSALRRATSPDTEPDIRLRALQVLSLIDLGPGPIQIERVLRGHTGKVECVAISPNGRWIASGGRDKTLRLWDRNTGKEVRRLQNLNMVPSCVAFSPGGGRVVAGGYIFLGIWEVQTGRLLRGLPALSRYGCVAFAPDGKTFTAGIGRIVQVWDVKSGVPLHSLHGHTAGPMSLAISPDGRYLLSGAAMGDRAVCLWDRVNYKLVHSFSGHGGRVTGWAFSPDSKQLATTCEDGAIRLWNAVSGTRLRELRHSAGQVSGAIFTADGEYLLSGNQRGTISRWDLLSGRVVQTLTGHSASVSQLALSPDGRTLVTAGGDSVRVWTVPR